MDGVRFFESACSEERLVAALDPGAVGFEVLCTRASSVHTASEGDVVLLEKRRSTGFVGSDPTVFDFLAAVVERLGFDGDADVVRGHYDVVRYEAGGFFRRHADFCPVRAPGVSYWHCLLGLEAPFHGGGTSVYGCGGEATTIVLKPGSLLMIGAGVEHEGLEVLEGTKTLLKFDLMLFAVPPIRHLVRLSCADGSMRLPAEPLRRSVFFARLLDFEAQREEHLVRGLSLEDVASVYAYLAGGDVLGEARERVREVMGTLCGAEAGLAPERFASLVERGFLLTRDENEAESFVELEGPCYALFVVLRRTTWEWEEYDGASRRSDEGVFLLTSSGLPVCSSGGPWLGPGASRVKGERDEGGGVSYSPSRAPLGGRGQDPISVATQALRAVLEARESSSTTSPEEKGGSLSEGVRGRLLEAASGPENSPANEGECSESATKTTQSWDHCNDGDGFYVRSYVTTGFTKAWLLYRRCSSSKEEPKALLGGPAPQGGVVGSLHESASFGEELRERADPMPLQPPPQLRHILKPLSPEKTAPPGPAEPLLSGAGGGEN